MWVLLTWAYSVSLDVIEKTGLKSALRAHLGCILDVNVENVGS